ncbi:hypothetical protein ACTQ49_00455 [Luteococcus sp. Sow4_B9]|uniref:hypothetical protein n=1 Tax=Luteococcus sp. Sow4_B9 TaxID=3438792 RepID=UPI003F9E6B8B
MDSEPLLHLYDTQLRDEAEVAEAPEVSRIGPLLAATWPERGRGFLTYRSIPKEMDLAALIDAALAHYVDDTRITQVKWKTRGHDDLPDLVDLLTQRGFEFEEQETVMAGTVESAIEAADPIPAGYGVIRATSADEIREAEALAGRVFGDTPADSATLGEALVARWEKDPESFEMWFVRGPEGQIVCSVASISSSAPSSLVSGAERARQNIEARACTVPSPRPAPSPPNSGDTDSCNPIARNSRARSFSALVWCLSRPRRQPSGTASPRHSHPLGDYRPL